MEDGNVEERVVEEEDDVVFYGHTVEKHGHTGSVESVRHKSRLDHDESTINILFVQGMTKSPSI